MSKQQIPAYLKKYSQHSILAQASIAGTSSFPKISLAKDRFTFTSDEGEEIFLNAEYLDFLIFDANPNISKAWFEKAYVPGVTEAPGCWSDNGVAPSLDAQQPQSHFCHSCPKNVWGSATSKMTGKGIKACTDFKKIAIYIIMDAYEGPAQLRIPPASLGAWRAYIEGLRKFDVGTGKRGLEPFMVVTRATWRAGANGLLGFDREDFAPEELIDVVMEEREKQVHLPWIGTDTRALELRSDTHTAKALPVPETKAPVAAVVDADYEDVDEEEEGGPVEAPAPKEPEKPTRKYARAPKTAPDAVKEPAKAGLSAPVKMSALDMARQKAASRASA